MIKAPDRAPLTYPHLVSPVFTPLDGASIYTAWRAGIYAVSGAGIYAA